VASPEKSPRRLRTRGINFCRHFRHFPSRGRHSRISKRCSSKIPRTSFAISRQMPARCPVKSPEWPEMHAQDSPSQSLGLILMTSEAPLKNRLSMIRSSGNFSHTANWLHSLPQTNPDPQLIYPMSCPSARSSSTWWGKDDKRHLILIASPLPYFSANRCGRLIRCSLFNLMSSFTPDLYKLYTRSADFWQ